MIIYKITNKINNKVYIGLTKNTLKYRWSRHISESKNINDTKHLYKAIRKYGVENFVIEQIDETNDFEKLGELERKYIKEFNSTDPTKGYNLTAGGEKNQYDGNSQAKLKVEDVINIRNIYDSCTISKKECWEKYYSWMSFSGFSKVWEGRTWVGLHYEVYNEKNLEYHKKQCAINKGEKNGNAKFTNKEVLEIRKYYTTHTLKDTFLKFKKEGQTKAGFRQVIDKTYKQIPIYSKIKKCWLLNNEIINIENYNPVSTIPVSGK